jgi:hypothetical protein
MDVKKYLIVQPHNLKSGMNYRFMHPLDCAWLVGARPRRAAGLRGHAGAMGGWHHGASMKTTTDAGQGMKIRLAGSWLAPVINQATSNATMKVSAIARNQLDALTGIFPSVGKSGFPCRNPAHVL